MKGSYFADVATLLGWLLGGFVALVVVIVPPVVALLPVVDPSGASAAPDNECKAATVVAAGDRVQCSGIVAPPEIIRSLLASEETLKGEVARLRIEVEGARDDERLRAAENLSLRTRLSATTDALASCEASRAPAVVECPPAWGGWPWVAAGVAVVVGGAAGYGVCRAAH